MRITARLSQQEINNISLDDKIILRLDSSQSKIKGKTIIVKVVDVVKEELRCAGCNVLMEELDKFHWYSKIYCESCYLKRKREATERSKRGLVTFYKNGRVKDEAFGRLKFGNKKAE